MSANWITPSTDDVATVMSGVVVGVIQQTGTQSNSSDEQTAKIQSAIDLVVKRIRGAIASGNRTPLSGTSGSIPAEAHQHALNLVVELLSASIPTLAKLVLNEQYQWAIKDSRDWVNRLRTGVPVEWPSDALTTDASGNVAADGGAAGDVVGEADMTTDGVPSKPYIPPLPVGNVQYTGTVNPNGVQVGNVNDQFLLYSTNGELQFVYTKSGTSGTNTSWIQAVV